jgi:hypothetical protein
VLKIRSAISNKKNGVVIGVKITSITSHECPKNRLATLRNEYFVWIGSNEGRKAGRHEDVKGGRDEDRREGIKT